MPTQLDGTPINVQASGGVITFPDATDISNGSDIAFYSADGRDLSVDSVTITQVDGVAVDSGLGSPGWVGDYTTSQTTLTSSETLPDGSTIPAGATRLRLTYTIDVSEIADSAYTIQIAVSDSAGGSNTDTFVLDVEPISQLNDIESFVLAASSAATEFDLQGNQQSTFGGIDPANTIGLDNVNRRLYYDGGGEIRRVDFDGTNDQSIFNISGGGLVWGIAVDADSNHIYFNERSEGKVTRTDLDGGNEATIVSGYGSLRALDIDLKNNYLFFAADNDGNIYRSNLDGSNLQSFSNGTGSESILKIKTDINRDRVYYTHEDSPGEKLYRMSINGNDVELVRDDLQGAGFAIDSEADKAYLSILVDDVIEVDAGDFSSDQRDISTGETFINDVGIKREA